ncbi:MAG: ATP-binding cassette domain-containing protein [Treponema sp.]|nr:ATP-binding cassette domain-containing protein [Treponema sp.]
MSIKIRIRKRLSRSFTLEMEFETSGDSTGACLGILGVSGSGKSMTLKCIAGIETPDEGFISINGRTLFDSAKKINLKPQARQVGYLFQNYALFPRMTALENIIAGLSGKGTGPEKKRKALDRIHQFGLDGLENRCPALLSGGQQQRVALARMLIREPEAILLDEPFSALDSGLREQMQILTLELLENRSDVILVTHSRDEVFKLCDELLIMDGGRALKKGKTREVFHSPGTIAAARLTGCKNISPIKRIGQREILALRWGLLLRTAVPVGEGIGHVGIRAHDFVPAENETYNRIPIALIRRSEEPFEEVVIFTNAAAGPKEKNELWWKYSKYLNYHGITDLFIPPESLILLEADDARQELQ